MLERTSEMAQKQENTWRLMSCMSQMHGREEIQETASIIVFKGLRVDIRRKEGDGWIGWLPPKFMSQEGCARHVTRRPVERRTCNIHRDQFLKPIEGQELRDQSHTQHPELFEAPHWLIIVVTPEEPETVPVG